MSWKDKLLPHLKPKLVPTIQFKDSKRCTACLDTGCRLCTEIVFPKTTSGADLPLDATDEELTTTFCPLASSKPRVKGMYNSYEELPDGPAANPKAAFGAAKAPFSCVPQSALLWLGNVMGGGAYKYGAYNFRETPVDASVYFDAIERHKALYFDGEDIDPESGAPHLAHIMACCALLLDSQELGVLQDDRNKTGLIRKMLDESAKAFTKFRKEHDERKQN